MRISLDDLYQAMQRLPPHSRVQGPYINIIIPQRVSTYRRSTNPPETMALTPTIRFVKETFGFEDEAWTDWALDLAEVK